MIPLIPNFSPSRSISFPSLNFTRRVAGRVEVRGKRVVFICILCRALGGRELRNNRVALERIEKGLNLVFTSVMNRVIIVGVSICDLRFACYILQLHMRSTLPSDPILTAPNLYTTDAKSLRRFSQLQVLETGIGGIGNVAVAVAVYELCR